MARANEAPAIDVQAGLVALDHDIPRVLAIMGASNLEDLGWSRPNRLTITIPLVASGANGTEEFLLKLGFQAYRTWPPSAQFVNPATLECVLPQDQHFIPKLTSQECRTHMDYPKPGGGKMQLICCSATFEFYEVLHSVEPHFVWGETDTFLTTVHAIRKAFATNYEGRFPKHE